jgi:hypothetical protein
MSINIQAYSGKYSEEFNKHLEAVKFCIERGLSYPAETSEFFKGKVCGDNLEDIQPSAVLQYIENGVPVNLPYEKVGYDAANIYIADIPKEVDVIKVSISE